MKKEFMGTCVENPFDEDDTEILAQVVYTADKISRKMFLALCEINQRLEKKMRKNPSNFEFFRNKNICFYRDINKDIEYFYNNPIITQKNHIEI